MRYVVLFFLILKSTVGLCQWPKNIIPNPSFESGNFHIGNGSCNYYVANSGAGNHTEFNEDIGSWYATGTFRRIGHMGSWFMQIGSPIDWVSHLSCPNFYNFPNGYNNPTSKFVVVGSNHDVTGGIRCELIEPIKGGKYYRIRMRLASTNNLLAPLPPPPFRPQINDLQINIEISGGGKILYVGKLYPPKWDYKFHTVQKIFYAAPEYDGMKNIKLFVPNIHGDVSTLLLDDLELFEQCPEQTIRQNLEYEVVEELEEGNVILAGSNVTTLKTSGDVTVKNSAKTTFKAGNEIILSWGFNVEREADFTAKIAPCGSNCASTNINIPTDYTICDNECITLGGPSVLGMSYSWSSVTDEHLQYLSSTTVAKPVFCPPDGGSGTYTYNLTITNACGESTTKTVYVHYDTESNPNPEFTITNSNLASNPDNPSLTIATVAHTEYVSVEILDCNNSILHSNIYKNGVDFTAPQEVNWQFGGFMSPCGCYKIRVRSKNYCYEEVKEEILQWNRITTPTNVQFENFTRCEGGKRKICFSGSGVASVKLQLFNRNGLRVVSNTYNITGNPYCMEIPNDNEITNGQYAIIIDFIGCDGTIKNMTGFVSVFPCGDSFTDGGGTWNGDDYYNGGVYYENLENGTIDSLYSVLSPNPVLEGALITYHIPQAGGVKITLLNANFEQKAILVQNETMATGDYEVQFSNADLLNGVNYYMIELSNNQQARHIKRFSVVK